MTTTPETQIVSPHPYDPHFDERSKLDQEIGKLERHLHMLRVKRNALLPITILPIDILVEIFKLAVTQAEDGSVIPKRIAEISWVCRPWREVALGHPILWTDISHSLSPRWKKAYLERSKPADISIAIDYIFRRPTFLDTFVLESELPRIRHLEVYPGCLSTDELISTIPAPVLQSVKLHGVKIHNALFSGTAPHLTAVHLRGCAGFRFDTIAFPQLMELHLAGINPKPSLQAWLTGLSSLPNLQRLALKDALDSSVLSENALVSLPHVDLPNLQSISAKEYAPRSVSSVSTLLCHISSHPNVVTTIKASELLGHLPAYLQLLTHLRVSEPPRSLSLLISHTYFYLTVLSSNNPDADTITSIKILYTWSDRSNLLQTLRQIPLRNLSSITLVESSGNSASFPRELWLDILSPLPDLRKLVLDTMYAASFMTYMGSESFHIPAAQTSILDQEHVDLNSFASTTPFPFPALRSLHLQTLSDHLWATAMSPEVPHSFCKVLEARREAGVGLEELVLRDFGPLRFEDVPLHRCADRVEEPMSAWSPA